MKIKNEKFLKKQLRTLIEKFPKHLVAITLLAKAVAGVYMLLREILGR